jgi:hypothetical protein
VIEDPVCIRLPYFDHRIGDGLTVSIVYDPGERDAFSFGTFLHKFVLRLSVNQTDAKEWTDCLAG